MTINHSKLHKYKVLIAVTLSSLLLSACFNSSESSSRYSQTPSKYMAIINMMDPGYVDSDLALVDLSKPTLTVNEGGFSGSGSDFTIAAHGEHFYRIGRFGTDTITKYAINAPYTPIYAYSTGTNSNPYDMVFVDDTKAYVIRYGDHKLWIVNPSANTESAFKTGEINLSTYADSDNVPEMSAGVVVDGKLYLTLQKLDTNFAPNNISTVLVIDTDTNVVLYEIALETTNPSNIVYHKDAGLFVQSDGDKTCFSCEPKTVSGGIERININDNTTNVVLWDTVDFGTNKLVIADASTAYISKYYGWDHQDLFQLNLDTGTVSSTVVDNINNVDIRGLHINDNKLWVGIADNGNPRIDLYNLADEAYEGTLQTAFYPEKVVFIDTTK